MTSALQATEALAAVPEPTIDEILPDPIIGLILRRDGPTSGSVRMPLTCERPRLAGWARLPAPAADVTKGAA